ncbi:MAG TPA: choice-of-anchor Q domain-containing protein [Tahibacter sp.]|uniref:DUF7452 domain-containing protein n=1 Tax=Tahibacter sp. TaxID=2056211 RepID=UPI002B537850|nr:choice-of-anchor Q domain-containing protein [Tahibacter sp.]HSX59816.1 choice-of-anchor Q domain-containing protein [Tahibacter sp.]
MNRDRRPFHNAGWLAALLLACPAAHAATLTWPNLVGVGSCLGTLQACIDSAAPGDTVQIGTDDLFVPDAYTAIDEFVTIRKSLTLRAVTGIDAVFAPRRGIAVQSPASGPVNVRIEDLVLRRGSLFVQHQSTDASTYALSRIRMVEADNTTGDCMIRMTGTGSGNPTFVIGDSTLLATGPTGLPRPAICADRFTGSWQVNLFRNRIRGENGVLGSGITVAGSAGGFVTLDANRVTGSRFVRGITVSQNTGSPPNRVTLQNNVVQGQDNLGGTDYALGVNLTNTDVHVVNNTVINGATGVAINGTTTAGNSGRIANNLIAFNSVVGLLVDSRVAAVVPNRYNLIHGNGSEAFTPGTGTITASPALSSARNPRPSGVSPAVNAGNNADAPTFPFGPTYDADGELRSVGTAVDIGAFELNFDFAVRQEASAANTGANETQIDALANRLGPSESLLVTPLRGSASATEAGATLGVYRVSNPPALYALFREDQLAISTGRRYAVMAPLDGRRTSVHMTTPGNIVNAYTQLDDPELNNRPEALLFALHNWNPGGVGGTYHDHRIGVSYLGGRWYIGNQDSVDMVSGVAFNFSVAPPGSPNAFSQPVGASPRSELRLAHPLLDDNDCAAPQLTRTGTPSSDTGFSLAYVRGGYGAPGRWVVVAEGTGSPTFAANTGFNVMLHGAQANECRDDRIFADGLEAVL